MCLFSILRQQAKKKGMNPLIQLTTTTQTDKLLALLHKFLVLYQSESSTVEWFLMANKYHQEQEAKDKAKIAFYTQTITQMTNTRVPLKQFAKKPVAMREFTPDFSTNYYGAKEVKTLADKKKHDQLKLTKKIKKEQKMAEKELRLDTQVSQRLKMDRDAEVYAMKRKKQDAVNKWVDQQARGQGEKKKKSKLF